MINILRYILYFLCVAVLPVVTSTVLLAIVAVYYGFDVGVGATIGAALGSVISTIIFDRPKRLALEKKIGIRKNNLNGTWNFRWWSDSQLFEDINHKMNVHVKGEEFSANFTCKNIDYYFVGKFDGNTTIAGYWSNGKAYLGSFLFNLDGAHKKLSGYWLGGSRQGFYRLDVMAGSIGEETNHDSPPSLVPGIQVVEKIKNEAELNNSKTS